MRGLAVRSEDFTCEDAAEVMRKRYRYRELILSGRLVLPYGRAAQLLGPDCLYHLYSLQELQKPHPRRRRSSSRKSS